jgi:hypothetical protein
VLLFLIVCFCWKDAMRLATVLVLSMMMMCFATVSSPAAAPGEQSEQAARSYISKVRIGGWIGNDALLVLPDRSAGAAPTGRGFGSVKLIEIGDTSFTVDYGGVKGKVTLDPTWQLAPHPDLTNWLISFMKGVGSKIDAQTPDISQEAVIRILHNGVAESSFLKVQQANPFQSLPDWMESINIKVTINPHDPTRVAFLSMTVTPQAYERLLKSLYSVPGQPKPAS